jgi:hypothetical protein
MWAIAACGARIGVKGGDLQIFSLSSQIWQK